MIDVFPDGRCRVEGVDADFFFPTGQRQGRSTEGMNAEEAEEEAAKFCGGCKRQWECSEYAIENGIHDGVWGFSEAKRREIRLSRKRKIKIAV